jgi:hypothetical protein
VATDRNSEELEGTTFKVYVFAVKEGRPIGTRDVVRGLDLSSSSVAYRHLQKLEALGLLEKTEYGEYLVKEKANVSGHLWIGRNLVPRLLIYCLFFVGLLGVEIAIIIIRFFVNKELPELNFVYLTAITALGVSIFSFESLLSFFREKRRLKLSSRQS